MSEEQLLADLRSDPDRIRFADVLAAIDQGYRFTATAFDNGPVSNSAEQNQGSCRVLAFARLHQLDEPATLALFGEHYRAVRDTPRGQDHQNIRAFIAHGWQGVRFHGEPLARPG